MLRSIYSLIITAVVSILLLSDPASAQVVESIRVDGNERIEDSTVLLQLSSKAGTVVDSSKVEADIKTIFSTGFFDQVSARFEPHGGSGTLVFQVVEKPAIRQVLLQGNKEVDNDTVKEKLNISARRFLDRKKLLAGVEAAKAYYQSKGYYGTDISFTTESVESNQVDLTFVVTEGQKKVIRDLVFEGNKTFDVDDLEDEIKTTTYSWYSSWLTGSGVVNKEQLDNDVRQLTRFYLTKGYVDVKIPTPVVEELEDSLKVTYKIEEGVEYQFSRISASGTLVENSEEKTLEGIESKEGETFNVEQLKKDTFTVSEKFTDVGYAFTNVEPITNINRDSHTVDVDFRIDHGSKVKINRINITGNKKTRDNVVRRSLDVHEQMTFSSSKIKRSQELLQRLGYFEEVTITPEPTAKKDEVDLNVSVREGQTGTFSIGGGISSGDGFIFTSRITESNLFGTGRSLTLDGSNGTERQNVVLSYNDSRVNDSRWAFGADALTVKREYDTFDKHEAGGAVSVGYPLDFIYPETFRDMDFAIKYQLVNVDISDIDFDAPTLVREQEGSSIASSVIPRVVRNTINNPLDPENGSRQLAETELAGLGGDQEFYLLTASNTFFYPLWKSPVGQFTFANRVRVDYGETFNDEDFPLYRRFFPGGINSIRGYPARELGPRENGEVYGGSKQLIANFELIYPIVQSVGLKGVLFYDVGNAFDDDDNISVGDLAQAVGFGFRWKSPIAPIRIEFGFPVDNEIGTQNLVTNFSFGSPF